MTLTLILDIAWEKNVITQFILVKGLVIKALIIKKSELNFSLSKI